MISIIVPVYNVEKFLYNCLRSISQQTYYKFEVILVDDGSTDTSGNICDEFVKKDKRFNVYHKKNGGVSSARNYGLDKIHGEWVYFCDADDILYEHALETLVNKFDENVDSTMGGYIRINYQGEIIEENNFDETINMSIEETLVDFYRGRFNMYNGYIWNRLFRRNIIEKHHLRFREDIYIKEDGLFLVQYLCKCNHGTFYTTKPIYKYVVHGSSVMNSKLKEVNKETTSRLIASLECHNVLKKSSYNKILPLAKMQVSYVRTELLKADRSTGFKRIRFMFLIDKMIAKEIGISPVLNNYIRRITSRL